MTRFNQHINKMFFNKILNFTGKYIKGLQIPYYY